MPLATAKQARAVGRNSAEAQQGDLWSVRDALEASLVAARERHDIFETTLTLLSLIELDRGEGVEPPLEMVTRVARCSLL